MSPYYKYKKESLKKKFNSAKETLCLMQGAIDEYNNTKSLYLKRAIIGYFQDFSECVIDMAETYLVMTENYVDGCSGIELINKSNIYGFIDTDLSRFLITVIKLSNRYTHDYYKREKVEEDILTYGVTKMHMMQMFLKVTEEKVTLECIMNN